MAAIYQPVGNKTLWASRVGAALNANSSAYTGTDDRAVLQAALDRIGSANGGTLVMDGLAALGGPLKVWSNTRIIANYRGAGFLMLANSGGSALNNKHFVSSYNGGSPVFDGSTIVDHNITVEGITIYGGAYNGAGGNASYGSLDSYGQFIGAMNWFGVQGLRLSGIEIYDGGGLITHCHNVFNVRVDDYKTIDQAVLHQFQIGGVVNLAGTTYSALGYPNLTGVRGGSDGFHINGPCDDFIGNGFALCVSDDGIGINADDTVIVPTAGATFPEYVGPLAFGGTNGWNSVFVGPITRVKISNIHCVCSLSTCRMFSGNGTGAYASYGNSRLDSVTVRGSSGVNFGRAVVMKPEYLGGNGNIGQVTIEDFNVTVGTAGNTGTDAYVNASANIDRLTIRNTSRILPQLGTGQSVLCTQGTIRDLDISDMHVWESSGTIPGPLVEINGGTVERLAVTQSSWRRESTETTSPLVLVTGSSTVGTVSLDQVQLDRVRNAVQFDASFTGSNATKVFCGTMQHLDVSSSDGVVRNDSTVNVSARVPTGTSGSVYTQGTATQATSTGSIAAI